MSLTLFPEALERLGGDSELFRMTAQVIAEDAPVELQKLRNSLVESEPHRASSAAHALKGMLSTFESGPAIDGLQSVETAAQSGQTDHAKQSLQSCEHEVLELIEKIRMAGEDQPS